MALTLDKNGEWIGTTGGVNLGTLNKQVKALETSRPKKVKKTQEEIRAQIMADPTFGFALRLSEYIVDQLGLDLGKTIFRNRQVSCYAPKSKQLQYSYRSLEDAKKNGFREYVSVAPVWYKNNLSVPSLINKKGIWAEVLHEVAHAYDHLTNGYRYGDAHGPLYQNCLEELIILFPFEEVQNI